MPRKKEYRSEESSYRISVEFLVQKKLLIERIKVKNPYILISNVVVGEHINMNDIKKLAEDIVNDFIEVYESEF